jgi:hypothetical protein
MKTKKIQQLIMSALLSLISSLAIAMPVTYSGVTFPSGDSSFADAYLPFTPGPNSITQGGITYDNPDYVLGAPDNASVSLGNGGTITVQFTDNSLTTSGDATADLWIFEFGPAIEDFQVEISTNAIDWIDLGFIRGQPSGFDIDSFAAVTSGTLYSYVRITDDITKGPFSPPLAGADINAVGAITSGPAAPEDPVVSVSEPSSLALLLCGLLVAGGMRKRKA